MLRHVTACCADGLSLTITATKLVRMAIDAMIKRDADEVCNITVMSVCCIATESRCRLLSRPKSPTRQP